MTTKGAVEVVGKIVEELTPFPTEERLRIVRASLTLLGDEPRAKGASDPVSGTGQDSPSGSAPDVGALPTRAQTWMKQNQLSLEQLQQGFHMDGDTVEVIASEIPGATNREKVRNAYILTGIGRLLTTGEPKFDDKAAREICEKYGFYDPTNHSKYVKGGNELSGKKETGWILTAPGLKHGAVLIADIAR